MLTIPVPVKADLDKGIKKTYLDMLFTTQDDAAHQVNVQLLRGTEEAQLPDGTTVTGYFIRYSDNATISLEGTAEGNVASVVMKKSCYNRVGQFALIIKIVADSIVNTVFYGEGTMYASATDTILDEENVVPSLEDLLAQIEVMEEGTQAANTAAVSANAAAARANTEADAAGKAAAQASSAAAKIDGLTVSAEKADEALAIITEVGGVKHITFKLPKGDKGEIGGIGPTGPKGDGMYGFSIDENGHLICSYDTDDPPPLSIDGRGHLIYNVSDEQKIDLGKVVGEGAVSIETDKTLTYENGILSVNTADAVEKDNTLPVTSAAVHTTVGNIEVLLQTI